MTGSQKRTTTDLSLGDILGLLWKRWKLVLSIASVPVLGALAWLHVATYKFQADLSLAPPQSSMAGSSGLQIGGNLGALASLAGVGGGVAGPGGLNYQLYREAIYERSTADRLAREAWVLKGIFPREWDEGLDSWRAPTDPLSVAKRTLKALAGMPGASWQPPDAARLQEYIVDEVRVATTTKTPVVRVSLQHPDPTFATRFLDALHSTVDEDLRTRLLARTDANIDYLSKKLGDVTIAEHRAALADALSDQEKLRMTASSTVAFAAEPFGPAAATRRPVSPNNAAVLAVALVFGLLAGVATALFSELWLGGRGS